MFDTVSVPAGATAGILLLHGGTGRGAHERERGARPFAVGHCFGGLAALELARADTAVRAVVSLHGGLATAAPGERITARVLAVCGAAAAFCPPTQRAAFEAEMTAAGADWQLLVLGGAQHGFSVPGITREACAYDTVADRRSWRAMLALFEDTM